MDDAGAPRQPASRRPRSVAARTLTWLTRQILFKDGGLLATLRGLLVAALLAFLVKLTPQSIMPAEMPWWLTACGVAVIIGVVSIVLVARRSLAGDDSTATARVPADAVDESQDPVRIVTPGSTVIEVTVRVRVRQNADGVVIVEPALKHSHLGLGQAAVRQTGEGGEQGLAG